MDHRTPTTGAATAAELWNSIHDTIERMDPDDALNALEEMYSTYIMHCIEDSVPHDLHDSIFTLHKGLRDILHAWKKIADMDHKS